MKRLFWLVCLFLATRGLLLAQSFEISPLQENYKGLIGEVIKVPLRFKNTSDKPLVIVLRKISAQIGGTQRNYFCPDNTCLDHKIEEYNLRIEPEQGFATLNIALEAGLAPGTSAVKYVASNKNNPAESVEFDLTFLVEEKGKKENIYTSHALALHDVYPNPVSDYAFVEYTLTSDHVKAKIVVHNILGNAIEEYALSPSENRVKIRTEALSEGIYFYTLYVDNEGVLTRKLIVRK